jgi:branched-chain amino acid transport system substrate-binding protein
VPILSFLHKDPGRIFVDYSESSDDGREALKRFRQKVSNGRLVNQWATGDELGRKVATSLSSEFHSNPRPGWIRGATTGLKQGDPSSHSPLVIGFVGALSGENKSLGTNMLNGIKLALEIWNETENEPKINLLSLDSKGSPDRAVGHRETLSSEKNLVGIVSGFSGETKALLHTLKSAGIAVLSPGASNPEIALNAEIFFRFVANDDSLAPGMARSLSGQGPSSVTIISDDSWYGEKLANQFAAATDLAIVEKVVLKPGSEVGLGELALQLSKDCPDVVFYGGYYEEAALLIRYLRENGCTSIFIAGDGVLDQEFIEMALGAAEASVVFATGCSVGADSGFYKNYVARFLEAPGIYSAEAYDAASALLKGIASGVRNGPEMTSFLRTVDFEGITKRIKFERNGELVGAPVYAYRVVNGRFEPMGEQ